MTDARDELYVGYLPKAPPALARWLRPRVTALVLLAGVLAVLVVASQRPFDRSVFEFGTTRGFEGTLREHPYPALLVARPGGGFSSYLLVATGKHGAETLAGVAGQDGRRARVEGTLIYRDDQTMVEVETILTMPPEGAAPVLGAEQLGTHTFTGEIVDSKCFLGVMKPGNTKPHRACASLCISGGIPPVLLVRERGGTVSYLLLVDAGGRPVNQRVLDMIAEPVEITGELVRTGDRLVLRADPKTYRRLD